MDCLVVSTSASISARMAFNNLDLDLETHPDGRIDISPAAKAEAFDA
jgi:hypothetical protein